MKPARSRRTYGTLTLSRQDVRRLRHEWSVVENALHPMRLLFAIAPAVSTSSTDERRTPVSSAAA